MALTIFILYLLSLASSSAALAIYLLAAAKLGKKQNTPLCLLSVLSVLCSIFGMFHHLSFPRGYVILWISEESLEPSSLITAFLSLIFSVVMIFVVMKRMFDIAQDSSAPSSAPLAASTASSGDGASEAAAQANEPASQKASETVEQNDVQTIAKAEEATAQSRSNLFRAIQEEFGFTERETELCKLICEGKSNPDIAKELFISENTVKTHIYNLFRKADVSSRMELASLISAYYSGRSDEQGSEG